MQIGRTSQRSGVTAQRMLLALGVYLAAVFVGGAAVAPWVWRLVLIIAPESHLAGEPFHRYVHRCIYAVALLGLWPLLGQLGLRQWKEVGLVWRDHPLVRLGQGIVLGLASLAIAVGLTMVSGARAFDLHHSGSEWVRHFLNAALAALGAGVLEEVLFRGALFASLRRVGSFVTAAGVTSGVYALTHFFKQVRHEGAIEPMSGLVVLGQMCAGFIEWRALLPAFLNLCIVGWALALARERTGTLWLSIGLHAGWIVWVKSFAFLTREPAIATSNPWIWGSAKLIDGWLAALILLATIPVISRLTRTGSGSTV